MAVRDDLRLLDKSLEMGFIARDGKPPTDRMFASGMKQKSRGLLSFTKKNYWIVFKSPMWLSYYQDQATGIDKGHTHSYTLMESFLHVNGELN